MANVTSNADKKKLALYSEERQALLSKQTVLISCMISSTSATEVFPIKKIDRLVKIGAELEFLLISCVNLSGMRLA